MSLSDLAHLVQEPAWMRSAACRGMDSKIFFPKQSKKRDAAEAICGTCAVQADCLEYALSFPSYYDFGVFGGTMAYQRKRMRQRRAS